MKTAKLFNNNQQFSVGWRLFIKFLTFHADSSFPRISKQSYFVFLMAAIFPNGNNFNFLWALFQLSIPTQFALLSDY